VKCDEAAPCGNCVRRNEECSLLDPVPRDIDAPLDPALPHSTQEWLQDLELMHHYSTSTSRLWLGVREPVREIWGSYIPQQAIRHPFLMHGILVGSSIPGTYS
jgi:hypothetical protein